MKKTTKKKICAAIIIIASILIWAVLLHPKSTPVPKFNFLKGKKLTTKIVKYQSIRKETRFIYSFKADFNDIAENAESELLSMGYKIMYVAKEYPPGGIRFYLPGKSFDPEVIVRIIYDSKMNGRSNPKNEYSIETGYISVEIIQYQDQNRWIAEIRKFIQGIIDFFKYRNVMD